MACCAGAVLTARWRAERAADHQRQLRVFPLPRRRFAPAECVPRWRSWVSGAMCSRLSGSGMARWARPGFICLPWLATAVGGRERGRSGSGSHLRVVDGERFQTGGRAAHVQPVRVNDGPRPRPSSPASERFSTPLSATRWNWTSCPPTRSTRCAGRHRAQPTWSIAVSSPALSRCQGYSMP
jgi:hypothetical protein